MNLILYLLQDTIEGISYEDFENCLKRGTYKKQFNTVLNIKDIPVKCIKYYYKIQDNSKKQASMDCYHIRKKLEFQDVSIENCGKCHIRCLNKLNNLEIERL